MTTENGDETELDRIVRQAREAQERGRVAQSQPDPLPDEEPGPPWAIGRTRGQFVLGAQLATRNGRRTGNAHIVGFRDGLAGRVAEVLTDAGNRMSLTHRELADLFHPPRWVSDVADVLARFGRPEDLEGAPHACMACPLEVRDLYATAHNAAGAVRRAVKGEGEMERALRKLGELEASLARFAPIMAAHFAADRAQVPPPVPPVWNNFTTSGGISRGDYVRLPDWPEGQGTEVQEVLLIDGLEALEVSGGQVVRADKVHRFDGQPPEVVAWTGGGWRLV
jgi:hypothetical protein